MRRHTCSYPVDFRYPSGDRYCGLPACGVYLGYWYCADHYDYQVDGFPPQLMEEL